MQEINTTKSTGDNGIDRATSTLEVDLGVAAAVREDIAFAQLNKSELTVVAVSKEICRVVISMTDNDGSRATVSREIGY